jgi:hypothetical protein
MHDSILARHAAPGGCRTRSSFTLVAEAPPRIGLTAVEFNRPCEPCQRTIDVAAETLLRIAADPEHLGASIGATLVLHT